MSHTEPRYEFRAFARKLDSVERRLRRLGEYYSVGESSEHYLISGKIESHIVKLRNGRLEIKSLLQQRRGLELWDPSFHAKFPVYKHALLVEVLPVLGLEKLTLEQHAYSADEFLDQVVAPQKELKAVLVHKRRFQFRLGECAAEIVDVTILDEPCASAAVESQGCEKTLAARDQLGLSNYQNTS